MKTSLRTLNPCPAALATRPFTAVYRRRQFLESSAVNPGPGPGASATPRVKGGVLTMQN